MSVAFYRALLDENHPTGEEEEHGVAWQLKKALYGARRAVLLFQELRETSHGEDRVHSGACGQHRRSTTRLGWCWQLCTVTTS